MPHKTPWILSDDRPAVIKRRGMVALGIGFLAFWLPYSIAYDFQLAAMAAGAIGGAITGGFARGIVEALNRAMRC